MLQFKNQKWTEIKTQLTSLVDIVVLLSIFPNQVWQILSLEAKDLIPASLFLSRRCNVWRAPKLPGLLARFPTPCSVIIPLKPQRPLFGTVASQWGQWYFQKIPGRRFQASRLCIQINRRYCKSGTWADVYVSRCPWKLWLITLLTCIPGRTQIFSASDGPRRNKTDRCCPQEAFRPSMTATTG